MSGYSNSKNAVEKVKDLLKQIAALPEGASLEVPSSQPQRLQYALRDGLKVAEKNPKSYPEYCTLKSRFVIKTRSTYIEICPRDTSPIDVGDPVVKLAKSLNMLIVEEAESYLQVVGSVVQHKAPKMIFPNAELDELAHTRLCKWAENNNYEVSLNPLTLTRCRESMSPTTQDTTTSLP